MTQEIIISILYIVIGILIILCKNNTNYFVGYRTFKSMKNQSNWHYAQIYSGKKILILGGLLLIFSIIAPLSELSSKNIATIHGIGVGVGTLLVIVSTEIALHKKEKNDK